MRTTLVALAIVATLLVVAASSASNREVASSTATTVGELQIRPTVANGPRGGALFRQTGANLRGWVVVWGLAPRTRHAVHFHGPNSSCGQKADPVAAHADLVADARGVAYATVKIRSPVQVLRKGIYYNVHARPLTADENPEIACANVVPIP
jgi:hypothetical protein